MADIRKKLADIVSDNLLGLALSFGFELNIFNAVAAVASEEKPGSPKDIAEYAGLKERYVKEWLCCVACGGFVEMNESGDRFWLKKENVDALSGPEPDPNLPTLSMVPHFAGVLKKLQDVYRKDGPPGMDYDDYHEIHKFIDIMGRMKYDKHLITDLLPITGMKERLEAGKCKILDVGCGTGSQSAKYASHFPNCDFTGIDLCHDAILAAEARREKEGLSNLTFIEMDARKLPDEWTKSFDWVIIFDACHDQLRPDLSLREIHRVLKDDGVLSMIEIMGSSNAYIDKQVGGAGATALYAISSFHCLPVGSNSPDALCLGSMWGQRRAAELFRECGFTNMEVVPTPFFKSNILYNCRK